MPNSAILSALEMVDRPGTFCAQGSIPFAMPRLDVQGLGLVSFPVPTAQAEDIITLCRQAPYGKGTQTVVDTKVRKVWELDPSNFSLGGPQWHQALDSMVEAVTEQLGIQGGQLVPDLYKLLIYGPGDFFLPHRDGEKIDGMIGTLVVVLPSLHKGGTLVVHHEGESEVFEAPEASVGMGIDYCAFYADCQHEVKPLTKGHRICLTYNLVFQSKGRRSKVQLMAPSLSAPVQVLAKVLSEETFPVGRVVVAMEHQYSCAALGPDLLKGVDKMRYEALRRAAETSQCTCYLALLTWHQSGSAVGDDDWYDGYYSRRQSRSRDTSSDSYEMDEIFDEDWTLEHWVDGEGSKANMGCIHVAKEEILSLEPLEDWEPSEEDFEGYTGNAGMTLDRWYYRAVVVICPKDREMELFLNEGTDAAIGGLDQLIKRWQKAKKVDKALLHQKAVEMANAIMAGWKHHPWPIGGNDRSLFADSLDLLDEPTLTRNYFGKILPEDLSSLPSESFLKSLTTETLSTCGDAILTVFSSTRSASFLRNIEILHRLSMIPLAKDEHRNLYSRCSGQLLVFLKGEIAKADGAKADGVRRDGARAEGAKADFLKPDAFLSWIEALVQLKTDPALQDLLNVTLPYVPMEGLQIPVQLNLKPPASKLHPCLKALDGWIQRGVDYLSTLTATTPQPFSDLKRPGELNCSCQYCQQLGRFLESPSSSRLEIKARQNDRLHLEEKIRRKVLDLDTKTICKGSPHRLVLTKNEASYQRACLKHQEDLGKLKTLKSKLAQLRAQKKS